MFLVDMKVEASVLVGPMMSSMANCGPCWLMSLPSTVVDLAETYLDLSTKCFFVITKTYFSRSYQCRLTRQLRRSSSPTEKEEYW